MKAFWLLLTLFTLAACQPNPNPIIADNNLLPHPFDVDSLIEEPQVFYPTVVSTGIDKFNTSFDPKEKTIYYTATAQKMGLTGIAFQEFENGTYGDPQWVPFAEADIPMADVHISPDGNRMLFTTFKDYDGKAEGFNFNLWQSQKENGSWSKPSPLSSTINSSGNEFYPILTENGTLYFNSDRSGNSDLYYARFENGSYQNPVRLPDNINTPGREADAFIAQDERYLIFVRVDEEDGFGNSDLYISYRTGENQWSDPKNMGARINSDQIDGSPCVSPNGKYLFFTSGRWDNALKNKAMESFLAFKKLHFSHLNASLNTYFVSFSAEDFR